MLDSPIKAQLSSHFAKLSRPVRIVANVDEQAVAQEMLGLLKELTALSSLISLETEHDPQQRMPSFSLSSDLFESSAAESKRKAGTIRFAGIPSGHEFTSLVLALLHVGGHPPKISEESRAQIIGLDGDFQFETYISLSCQNCPEVVQALNLIAALNPKVGHSMIDGALFQDEVNARQIMSVPSIYLNGKPFAQGRMSVDAILGKLDTRVLAREAEKIKALPPFDLLIVGAGPAGAAAAVYGARKGIRVGLVAERFGGQVMDTMTIENFISVPETEGPKLVAALEEHVKSYAVDILNLQRAEALKPAQKAGENISIELASGAILRSKTVILATGARWRELNVPGENEYRGRGVAYCPHCDGPLFKGKRVAVVGGGNSGVEAAIDLAGFVEHVTLLQFDEHLRADAVLQKKLFSLHNVSVLTHAQTTEIKGDGKKVTELRYLERSTERLHSVEVAGVFVQIGLLPNSDWLKGTLKLSRYGEIEVDQHGQTSLPGVFAAGDVTTVPYKQIIIAMGDGAKAALGAFDHLIRH
ncbi:MAG: alkyl hydroperoxide reductase subunit F [Pseudomonadota bacterium]